MIGGGKLPNSSLNCISNARSINWCTILYVPNYLMLNRMIETLRKSFLKVLVKYTLRIEVWLWKVLLSQQFQFKRFCDEKMESAHFPDADV